MRANSSKERSSTESDSLDGARNIGTGIAAALADVGIHTMTSLREVTPPVAYQRMSARRPMEHLPVCFYLYSLKGALEDRDWRSLTDDEKADLRDAI